MASRTPIPTGMQAEAVRTLDSVLFRRELVPLSPKVSPGVSAKILRTPPEVRKNLRKSGVSSGVPEVGLEPTLPEWNRILSPRCYVLACPTVLENSACLSRIRARSKAAFSVASGSVLALLLPHCCHCCHAAVGYFACCALHLRPLVVVAQALLWYFCLPDSGSNMRPQPGHSSSGA
jgi:hypothetical protein